MRNVFNPQMSLDGVAIGSIQFDPRSRDDIPQILRGLQHIYTEPALRERVFAILREVMPDRVNGQGKADANTGRPGMEQWRILVLGVLRLGLNADFDRIHELANQHSTLRQMLGHGDWSDKTEYKAQTLKDNLRLFTPELLDRINQAVVDAGHVLVKKKDPQGGLAARCDSFVVETHVHYGACQATCRLTYAANGCLFVVLRWAATTESRSGLRVTGPAGDQSRVGPDQRAGLSARALM